MNILVVGLGSMGKRRIRLMQKNMASGDKIFGVDTNEKRCEDCEKEYGIISYTNLANALKNIDFYAAFVCTAPLSHSDIIFQCLQHKIHVFAEINLVSDGYKKNIELAKKNNVKLFLSSTPLYRKEIEYIKKEVINTDGKICYSYHVGQYLPDWHPWDILQDFFISSKKTNGCREIFAIELPWLIDTFGEIVSVQVIKDKITKLPIEYNDNYIVILRHKSGHKGVLLVDVVSRKAIRELTIYGENLFICWNGTPNGLKKLNLNSKQLDEVDLYSNTTVEHINGYSDNVIENAYSEEIKNFFDIINEKSKSRYSFEQDLSVIKIIDEIEGVEI